MKFLCFTIMVFSSFLTPCAAQTGHLVIIGGGGRPPAVIQKIINLAGSEQSKIIIIPVASSVPEEVAIFQRDQFKEAGAGSVEYIIFDSVTVNNDSNIAKIKNATCIFFSGGDQRRLTKVLLFTKMLASIKQLYFNGGVIAGTSAGAAVMSEIMITGNELRNPDSTRSFKSIKSRNIETTPGFGFINEAIIDQHFIARKRHNRLMSLVLEHPSLIGIGIDESTAIWVNSDRVLEVIGDQTVMIIAPPDISQISKDGNDNFAFHGMVIHVLKSGQKYDLKNKTVIQ
jgi:cyanophycinase